MAATMKLVASKPDPRPLPRAIRSALDSVSENSLRAAVEQIAVPRVYGTPENDAIRDWVAEKFAETAIGRASIHVDNAGNVVAGDPRRARILLGAHHDAVPGTPGADDNASAVAVLLAAAQAIGALDAVCYVAFDGEECNLAGSRQFIEGLGRNRLEQVHVLEMVGYTSKLPGSQQNPVPMVQAPTVGDFLGLVGSHASSGALDHVLGCAGQCSVPVYGLYLPPVPFDTIRAMSPHVFRSDHAPFWAAGIPALMWTDTAEFRNPHYHRPTDTPETLDYAFLAEVARLLIHTVLTAIHAPA